jgi:hypothetical protein
MAGGANGGRRRMDARYSDIGRREKYPIGPKPTQGNGDCLPDPQQGRRDPGAAPERRGLPVAPLRATNKDRSGPATSRSAVPHNQAP